RPADTTGIRRAVSHRGVRFRAAARLRASPAAHWRSHLAACLPATRPRRPHRFATRRPIAVRKRARVSRPDPDHPAGIAVDHLLNAPAWIMAALQGVLYLVLGPWLVGWVRLVKARLANRRGAPAHQPWRDLVRLFG